MSGINPFTDSYSKETFIFMAKSISAKRMRRTSLKEDRAARSSTRGTNNVYDFKTSDRAAKTGEVSQKPKNFTIIPRNQAQENYLDALKDEQNTIIVAMGPAGTGKSMMATKIAIQGLIEGRYKKIVIARPTVSAGEDIGFLPGTAYEKLKVWNAPIIDVFKEIYSVQEFDHLIENEIVEIVGIGFCRGRTFKDSFVIIDESQNMTPSQIKMCATRIGDNSRMVITGDLRQHDRGFEVNGLRDFVDRLEASGSQSIEICRFEHCDIERHPIIEEVLRLYGDE